MVENLCPTSKAEISTHGGGGGASPKTYNMGSAGAQKLDMDSKMPPQAAFWKKNTQKHRETNCKVLKTQLE